MITIVEDQVTPFLQSMASKLTNTKPLMNVISQQMVEAARENIETEGVSLGSAWKKASKFTEATKTSGKGLLRNSDRLINTLFASYTDTEAIAASPLIYSALMHFGGTVKAKKVLGSVSRKKDVWAMEQYFWRQYYESDKTEKSFMFMAMHIHKYGSYDVPARPFMGLGTKHVDEIKETITNYITQ